MHSVYRMPPAGRIHKCHTPLESGPAARRRPSRLPDLTAVAVLSFRGCGDELRLWNDMIFVDVPRTLLNAAALAPRPCRWTAIVARTCAPTFPGHPSRPPCETCNSTGWICETDHTRPWTHEPGCGAGDPCHVCNASDPPDVSGVIETVTV